MYQFFVNIKGCKRLKKMKKSFAKKFSTLKNSTFKLSIPDHLIRVNEINHTIAAFFHDVCGILYLGCMVRNVGNFSCK